ncbi:hypothetical protein FRC00_009673, partial [Tulasnella sp. 408]
DTRAHRSPTERPRYLVHPLHQLHHLYHPRPYCLLVRRLWRHHHHYHQDFYYLYQDFFHHHHHHHHFKVVQHHQQGVLNHYRFRCYSDPLRAVRWCV